MIRTTGNREDSQRIAEIFKKPDKKYLLNMGAGKLARLFDTTREAIYEAKRIARSITSHDLPKILIIDIETSPLMAYVWQKSVWGANIAEDKILSEWFVLTWSAKWLFDDAVFGDALKSTEAVMEDDSRLMKRLWSILDNADIVIAHNGDKFDVPNINTRFVVHGFPPPAPYQTIDTLRIARRQFGFTHNNLNALARVFDIDSKIETNFELWKRCIKGDSQALNEMLRYNKKDVQILEELYLRMRPWIKQHPNVSLFIDDKDARCPTCGSNKLSPTGKSYYTYVSRFDVMRCECGALSRVRKSNIEKEKKKNTLVSLAK